MKEMVYQIVDDIVVSFVHHFDEARRWIFVLYPHLDLGLLDPFNVVLDREMVDEE